METPNAAEPVTSAVASPVSSSPASSSGGEEPGEKLPFGMMKDRAATAKKTLGPQLLHMKDQTSKKLEKYQPTIVKAKTSATAGLTTAASKMKEGSTQGWSMLKTKLAAAGPVAERIHTLGLNVMTDIYLGDTSVDMLECVEDPRAASCLFLMKYRAGYPAADSPSRVKGLMRMSTSIC